MKDRTLLDIKQQIQSLAPPSQHHTLNLEVLRVLIALHLQELHLLRALH